MIGLASELRKSPFRLYLEWPGREATCMAFFVKVISLVESAGTVRTC